MLSSTDRNALHYWIQNKYGISLGATSASVNPEDITDAAAVWVADDIAQADASAVTTWTDRVQSVALTQGSGTLQPLYRTAGLGGQPAVEFDASNDRLSAATCISHTSSGHIFAVVRFRHVMAGGSSDRIVDFFGSQGLAMERTALGSGTSGLFCTVGSSYWRVGPSNSVAPATDYLMELNSNGSAWELRLNGVVQTTSDLFGHANVGAWFDQLSDPLATVGFSAGVPLNGYVAALIVIGKDPPLHRGWVQDNDRW